MAHKPEFCLGCNKFVDGLTRYRVLPKEYYAGNQGFPYDTYFPLCFPCKDELEKLVLNKELQNGHWKECVQLEIPIYFLLLKNFIMRKK